MSTGGIPSGTPRPEIVGRLAAAFRAGEVPAVLLRAPGTEAGAASNVGDGAWRHDLDVLVPRGARAVTDRAMAGLGWRLALGGLGAWARVPTVSYHWDRSPSLDVHRGLPVGPLPPGSLRAFEKLLLERARPTPCGIPAPDAASLAVFSALQAARPGPFRAMWLADLDGHLRTCGRDEAVALASSVGLGEAIHWATGPEASSVGARSAGVIGGGLRGAVWRTLCWVVPRVPAHRARAVLGGMPQPGDTIARVRFCGLELRAGPGAFIPQPVSEPMVPRALAALPEEGTRVMVDVGTGVGAVALAVARSRPDVEVHGCDISKAGLRWAVRNARRLGVANVSFHRGSLLDPLSEQLSGRVDVLTVNVPYVPAHVVTGRARDLDRAVVGQGVDGLDLQREALDGSMVFLAPQGHLVIQMTDDQWELFEPSMVGWRMAPNGVTRSGPVDVVGEGIADLWPDVGRKS